ncbi:hypothetical protein HHI36_008413 [Cryptolaemus montrouzieri]|uniref:Dynein assembly factor 3, axonemal n=1 Tax=Cryptolaemus montrouzieri TaxID=559131 RepID=A0ABD2MSB2_9CUCU
MFWGLTPALDFQAKYRPKDSKNFNILIIGGSDCRHILKTVARKYRYEQIELNFYLMEGCMETVARQLLLLLLSFMPRKELGEVQKTRIFMELYGNTIVRPYVSKFLNSTAKELLKMITDYEYLRAIMPFLQLEIKYKERDYLENLMKFWCSVDDFDITDSWDRRVRKMLGIRYDAKFGAFDWDLNMRFHSVGGRQVGNQEYKSFRTNGVSFVWLESEVSKPNRSLVCATIPNGEKYIHYGYLGDIQTGPFVSFGLDCEDEEFLKSTNDQNKFRATDITERNLRQIFHEIETGKEYVHTLTNDLMMGAIRMQEYNQIIDISSEKNLIKPKNYKTIDIRDINIKFLSISQLKQMAYKGEFKDFFNLIYFCSTYLQYFNTDAINNISAKKSMLLIENQRFVLNNREKNLLDFAESIKEKVKGINGIVMGSDPLQDDYMEYVLKA